MELSFGTRLKHAWNAFSGKSANSYMNYGMSYTYRADRPRLKRGVERTIIASIFNRIALDVSSHEIRHVKLDQDERYQETMKKSKLNNCLTLEANIDQTARTFFHDAVYSMLGEGYIAIVPVDTTVDPTNSNSFDVETMRVGKILTWYPRHVRIEVYNDRTGKHEEITMPKSSVCIVENPLYAVVNEQNSTLQRLLRKLAILDAIDEQSGAGKLDLIIQLPYVVKTQARKDQAEERRKSIEDQLSGTKYGIAYTDGTERITQLNRPINNNLMTQIEYLTSMLYSQLGITQSVMDGTADERTMLNYNNRTIEPILSAIIDEMKRKFLSKTARSQGQSIMFFSDPFKLVPVDAIAEIADKFTRNEIMTSNEIRGKIGLRPSDDPKADMLINSNLNQPDAGMEEMPPDYEEGEIQNGTTV